MTLTQKILTVAADARGDQPRTANMPTAEQIRREARKIQRAIDEVEARCIFPVCLSDNLAGVEIREQFNARPLPIVNLFANAMKPLKKAQYMKVMHFILNKATFDDLARALAVNDDTYDVYFNMDFYTNVIEVSSEEEKRSKPQTDIDVKFTTENEVEFSRSVGNEGNMFQSRVIMN